MRTYVGIDLGTTNSSICSFDGKETAVWKSPEQSDVTPSAIFVDRKGHHVFGQKAIRRALNDDKNAVTLFKRYLGTNKIYELPASGSRLTPVECSAEILRVLYGYLPEEIRSDPETVTVITVPAAFSQIKKDATLEAAKMAKIGRVILMQEPVAAVMSILKRDNRDKIFLVYDLGGGTFDISIAQHINGHVNLLAQGGREMCGGRDIDRRIYSDRILPWLRAHFDIPENPDADPHWVELKKRVLLAVEDAKIALSGSETSDLYMDEDAVDIQDLKGEDVYIDLTLSRNDLTEIIEEMAAETAELSRETMIRAGIRKADADQIIFIGGPTMYAPLREAVCRNLGISRGTSVNPMTSVAEGASIYAESIHWDSDSLVTKEKSEELATQQDIKIRYEKRTSLDWGRVAVLARDSALRIVRIQSVCQDTTERSEKDEKTFKEGERFFDSGEVPFSGQVIVNVPLPEMGVHGFKLDIFDGSKENLLESRKIEITRIFASIRSVPASHSIALKVLDSIGGKAVPLYLVEENDPLPKYGSITLHAGEQLVGGGSGALSFSLWEGEIREPVDDNRYIGTYRIPASKIGRCIVPVGTVIECDYEMTEAGNIRLGASIPSIGLYMGSQNFYSRIEGQVDLQDTASLVRETNQLLERTAQMKQRIVDEKLSEIRLSLVKIRDVFSHSADSEEIAASEDKLLHCYRDIAVLAKNMRLSSAHRSFRMQRTDLKKQKDMLWPQKLPGSTTTLIWRTMQLRWVHRILKNR